MSYVSLPLFSDQDYSYAVALEGESYRIRFTYNSIMKLYTMAVSDADANTLISGIGLVPSYPILLDFVVSKLTGTFLLTPKSETAVEFYKLYPDKIHLYYELTYLYAATD